MGIKYREGYEYQLAKDYMIETGIRIPEFIDTHYVSLTPTGILMIREGYAWDGASGPTIDSKSSMRGALVHDALYQLIRTGYLPEEFRVLADELFIKILIQDGMWRWRARLWFWAVRKFAGYAASKDAEPEILTAP